MMKSIFLAGYILGMCQILYAQEDHNKEHGEHQEMHQEKSHKHSLSLILGHTHLSEGLKNGEKQWISAPSWAFNYNYLINHKWAVGLHTDIIIEEFQVKSDKTGTGDEDIGIERSFPISIVGAGSYKPLHYLSVIIGGGIEYAPEETFGLIRIGLEPSVELSEKWEMVFSMVYDLKIDAYNNWTLGVGVARLF